MTLGASASVVSDDAIPPSLLQHTETNLRNAYFHAAKANLRDLELHPREILNADGFAANPVDPSVGIKKAIDAMSKTAAKEVEAVEKQKDTEARNNENVPTDTNASGQLVSTSNDTSPPLKRLKNDVDSPAGKTQNKKIKKTVRNLSSAFASLAKAATRRVRSDWSTAYGLLVSDRVSIEQVVKESQDQETRQKWRTETITKRHVELRSRVKESTKVDDDSRNDSRKGQTLTDIEASTWHAATELPKADERDTHELTSYAEAAEETGRKEWVVGALRWCHDCFVDFFYAGRAVEYEVKKERRVFFAEHGRRMSDAKLDALRNELSSGYLGLKGDPGLVPVRSRDEETSKDDKDIEIKRLPTLLDVGSCWDYFRVFETNGDYTVTAFDLCPRTCSVFRCDFLELEVTAEGSDMVVGQEEDQGTRALTSYPVNSTSAVILSLVLSYVPTPKMRGEMIRKARQVLLDNGRGLLLITTPHSTDRAYSQKNKTNMLSVWRENIERMGFERVKYERKHAVHCMAFRTIGIGPGSMTQGNALPLPIAFDGLERQATKV